MIKWVIRLAFITCLLGLVGTIAIILHLHGKQEGQKILHSQRKRSDTINILKRDTGVIKPNPPNSLDTPKALIIEKKEDSASSILRAPKEIREKADETTTEKTDEKQALLNTTAHHNAVKQKENKKQQRANLLNPSELKHLVRQINIVKLKNGIYSNCVQIHISADPNNKRALSQVETYLRKHKFTIAGREVVEKKVKGIKVTPNEGCIRITIGAF